MELHPQGPIFRNTKGRPWTKGSVGNRFARLTKKLEFPVTAYAFRHGFGTQSIKKGVDPITVSQLMGHADTRMLERVYQHLDGDDAHLQAALLQATG